MLVIISWVRFYNNYSILKSCKLNYTINSIQSKDWFFLLFQISYTIPPNKIPGRLGLLVTLSLCMTNTLNSVSKTAPRATDHTVTAIVYWIVLCLLSILAAMVEYAIILLFMYHSQSGKVKRSTSLKSSGKVDTWIQDDPVSLDNRIHPADKWMLILSIILSPITITIFWFYFASFWCQTVISRNMIIE